MNVDRYSKKVEVGSGVELVVYDGIQNVSFYDLNILVSPYDVFTGVVDFYIGDTLVKSETFANEKKNVVFAPTPPDFPEIFPPTVPKSYIDIGLGDGYIVTGSHLRASVKIRNNGGKIVVFDIHFTRKYR